MDDEKKINEKFEEYWLQVTKTHGVISDREKASALMGFYHGYLLGKQDGFVDATRRVSVDPEGVQ